MTDFLERKKKHKSGIHQLHDTKLFLWLASHNPLRRAKKLRTQFLIVLIFAGVLSVLTWKIVWRQQPGAWQVLKNIPGLMPDKEAFVEELREKAKNYYLPESEDDEAADGQLKPFFDSADNYTSVYIYDKEDGYYLTGKVAPLVYSSTWNLFYSMIFQITYSTYYDTHEPAGLSDDFSVDMEFANGTARVFITFFHNSRITIPYFVFSLGVSIFLFLFIMLMFIRYKIGYVLKLKDEILLISGGDLSHPIPDFGNDEIGILSRELDKLRIALDENMQQETESRKANQDLITAMSHDLRTPLTILNGYLEVMKLKRNPGMQEEYLKRCLDKTNDIRQMTDRMFEYALVFEKTEHITLCEIPVLLIHQCLTEHIDFLQLAGFTVEQTLCESPGIIAGDETMLKRIFQNLFSNILKYGDKKDAVRVSCSMEQDNIKVTLSNSVKENTDGIESNHVGLKSVEKMVKLHGGTLFVSNTSGVYIVNLTLPLMNTKSHK